MNLTQWLRERARAEQRPSAIAGGPSFAYVFGWTLVLLLAVEAVTGAALAAFYAPSTTDAWASVAYVQERMAGGAVSLFANDAKIGEGRLDKTVLFRFSGYAGMDIGRDNGGVVDRNYADRAPFTFTGTIKKVTFDIKPHLTSEDEQALHESAHHGHVAHGISG